MAAAMSSSMQPIDSSSTPFSPTKRQQESPETDLPEPQAKKQKITETFQCDVCSVDCNNKSGYEEHILGKKHCKKMNMPEAKAENKEITATFRCDACSVNCDTKIDYESHMLGKKHAKKATSNTIKRQQGSSQTDLPKPKAENKEITEYFRCDVCTVEYSNKSGYELHMLGKMHLKKMNQFDAINAAVSSTCSSHLSTLSTPETSTVSMTGKTSTAVSVVSSVVSTVVSSMTETSSTMSTDVPEKLD